MSGIVHISFRFDVCAMCMHVELCTGTFRCSVCVSFNRDMYGVCVWAFEHVFINIQSVLGCCVHSYVLLLGIGLII